MSCWRILLIGACVQWLLAACASSPRPLQSGLDAPAGRLRPLAAQDERDAYLAALEQASERCAPQAVIERG